VDDRPTVRRIRDDLYLAVEDHDHGVRGVALPHDYIAGAESTRPPEGGQLVSIT
jgi:hypothetical protein